MHMVFFQKMETNLTNQKLSLTMTKPNDASLAIQKEDFMQKNQKEKWSVRRGTRRTTALLTAIVMMISVATVYAASIKGITLYCDGIKREFFTARSTVGEVLKDNNILLGELDKVEPAADQLLSEETTITVSRGVRITITDKGKIRSVITTAMRAKEALEENGIFLNEHDMLSCRLEDRVEEGMNLLVTRVTLGYYEENVVLPYEVEYRDNDQLPFGTENVLQEGEDGVMVRGTQIMYCDGVEQDHIVVKEERVREPIAKIIERGTDNAYVTASGDMIAYKDVITCSATAYDPSHQSPGSRYYGLTAMGTRARVGAIAVDPRVIPLGSKLYVEAVDGSWSYGFCTAEDTGGAIKGNRIDLFYNTRREALQFGRRQAKVYILE
ncbi:MAG: DUF348 domain-containing protein [Ruminococcaceae bacterium]|nr:DUF348 domain-containing protein [Oscillospiraceae bacterium]